ncbi:MAG: hypothetical protein ACJAUN_001926, partial [Alcanivorax sp.]
HIEISNGTTDLAPQLLLQLVEASPLFGVQRVHGNPFSLCVTAITLHGTAMTQEADFA